MDGPPICDASYNELIEQIQSLSCPNESKKAILDIINRIKYTVTETIKKHTEMTALLENATQIQAETIKKLEDEKARNESVMRNNAKNSGVTRKSTALTNLAKKQDTIETEEESDINTIAPSKETTSTSPPKSVNKYNERNKEKDGKTEKKQQGGQFNHVGHTLTAEDALSKIEILKAASYEVKDVILGVYGRGGSPKIRYSIGMNPAPYITRYIIYKDMQNYRPYPTNPKCVVWYDVSVYSYIAYLHWTCNLPVLKIKDCLENFSMGIVSPSPGTIEHALTLFAQKCSASLKFLYAKALEENVLYTDATYVFLNGKHAYIRNLSCKEFALYFGLTSKSYEDIQKIKVFDEYHGILVHDHEVVMYHFGSNEHGECIVHIMRYCRKNKEDTENDWSKLLADFFMQWQNQKVLAIERGEKCFTPEIIRQISDEYDEIMVEGWLQHRFTQHKYNIEREETFLRRIGRYKNHHLRYLFNFEVDWSNNISERDLRAAKMHSNVTGGFRTETGLDRYCNGFSVIQTMRKQQINIFRGIQWIFENEENIFNPETIQELKNIFLF